MKMEAILKNKYERLDSITHSAQCDDEENDPLRLLPNELVLHVFQYVPPRQLVRVCTLVNKRWQSFFCDSNFWQLRMKQSGNYSVLLEKLPSLQINWARLCITTVYEINIVKSFDSKGKLSLNPWNIMYWSWKNSQNSTTEVVDGIPFNTHCKEYANFDRHYSSSWTIESWIKREDPKDEQVLKENRDSVENYATSYRWCCREQYIILSKYGLTNDIMDVVQPSIEVSEWFAARWDCGSVFEIMIQLLGSEGSVIDEFHFSERTEQWQGGELGWRKVEHVFTSYGPGVRFVRFCDAGKDTQFWAGHYGSKMAAACVNMKFN